MGLSSPPPRSAQHHTSQCCRSHPSRSQPCHTAKPPHNCRGPRLHTRRSRHQQEALHLPRYAHSILSLRAPRGRHRSFRRLSTIPLESCLIWHLRPGQKLRQKISLPARGGMQRAQERRCKPRGLPHNHHEFELSNRDQDLHVQLPKLRQLVHHSTRRTRCPQSPISRPLERPREACSGSPHPQAREDQVGKVRRTPLPSSKSSTVVWRAAAPPASARDRCPPRCRPRSGRPPRSRAPSSRPPPSSWGSPG